MRNRGSSLLQFLHLSRPVQCSHMVFESCSSSAESQSQSQDHLTTPTRVPLMSPRPRTPQYRYPYQIMEPWVAQSSSPQAYRSPRYAYNIGYPYYMPESMLQHQFAEQVNVPLVVGEVEKKVDQSEAMDEIVRSIRRISDLYEELPESLREQVNLEIMKIATTKRSRSPMDVSSVSSTRGLNQDLGMESPHRLERFKIRTVNAGNIVKEGQKQRSDA